MFIQKCIYLIYPELYYYDVKHLLRLAYIYVIGSINVLILFKSKEMYLLANYISALKPFRCY